MAPFDPHVLAELLEKALALPADARARFLDGACSGNKALRDELASLLAAHDAGAGYFEQLSDQIVVPALLALPSTSEEPRRGRTIAHYQLLEELGSGGMGVVYKARDLRLDRFVALKFLPAHLSTDPKAKDSLVAEARAASGLDHPNIGVVHDIAETQEGRLFLVMAYYEGETLARRNARGRMAVGEALGITRTIASALAAAHQKGITHRDVKPSNIIITGGGQAKLLDFGIAGVASSTLGAEEPARGTIAYMSPEQTQGSTHDHRTDLWSLGVVLYEMLAGKRPFRAETDDRLIDAIRHDTWEPIDKQHSEIPVEVNRILARCLAKDPGDRYATAQQLLAAFETIDDALAVPPRGAGRARQLLIYGGIALLICLVSGGALYFTRDTSPGERAAAELSTRVAVMPLTVANADPEVNYLAGGMMSELITQLSKRVELRVIARASALGSGGTGGNSVVIGRSLGAGTVLDGAIRKTTDRIEVRVRLLDTKSGYELWGDTYEVPLAGLQTVPQQIANKVAEVLEVSPDRRAQRPSPGTSSPEAYLLYLKGRHVLDKWDAESAAQARSCFERALDLDPAFAEAWTGLADTYHVLGGLATLPAADAYPRTRAAAERALGLDPNLAAGHVSLATALSAYYWDFDEAARHIRRAIELNPSDATAHNLLSEHLRYRGRFDEALAEARLAEELDPLAPVHQIDTGVVLYLARRYDEAIAQYHRVLSMKPSHTYTYFPLALAYVQQRQFDHAFDALDKAGYGGRLKVQQHTLRGYIFGRMQRPAEARHELERLNQLSRREHVSPWHFAIVHLGLGEHDRAIGFLEQALSDRAWQLRLLPVEPMFDPIRANPRFRELIAKVR